MQQEASNKGLIIGVVAVAVLIFAGLTWAILSAPSEGPGLIGNAEFTDTDSPFVGPAESNVTVHIYGDFQCPACKVAEPALKAAMNEFKDRVKFVWKDFPLSNIHKNARNASNVARCAQDQGKFWEMHDALYVNQEAWSGQSDPGPTFITYAQQLGLDGNALKTCYDARTHNARVSADESEGIRNGVNSTPTFFVNKAKYIGMSPDQWSSVLNAALAAQGTGQ